MCRDKDKDVDVERVKRALDLDLFKSPQAFLDPRSSTQPVRNVKLSKGYNTASIETIIIPPANPLPCLYTLVCFKNKYTSISAIHFHYKCMIC